MKRLLVFISLFSFCVSLAASLDAWSEPKRFIVVPIMHFKQHKDNPTQVPIGTPISLVVIGAALLFLPSILGVTSSTIFGQEGGTVTGPSGTEYPTS